MFNFEQEITKWRHQLAARGIKEQALDELESHLREDVEQQMGSGADAESSFKSAVQRLGAAHMLQGEFMKLDTKHLQTMKVKRFCLRLVSIILSVVLTILLLKSELDLKERLLAFGALMLWVVFLSSGRFVSKFLPVLSSQQLRVAHGLLGLAVFAWLMIFFYVILPLCNFTVGEVGVATIWAMTPCAMVGGIIDGMDEARFGVAHHLADTL